MLLAGASYAVSNSVYNLASKYKFNQLTSIFDRIASLRDAVLFKLSLKFDDEGFIRKYQKNLSVNLLMHLIEGNPKSEVVIRSVLINSFDQAQTFLSQANRLSSISKVSDVCEKIHDLLMKDSASLNEVEKRKLPVLLLQLYALEKMLNFEESKLQKIKDYVQAKIDEFDEAYVAAAIEYMIDNNCNVFGEVEGLLEKAKDKLQSFKEPETLGEHKEFYFSILRCHRKKYPNVYTDKSGELPKMFYPIYFLVINGSDYIAQISLILDYFEAVTAPTCYMEKDGPEITLAKCNLGIEDWAEALNQIFYDPDFRQHAKDRCVVSEAILTRLEKLISKEPLISTDYPRFRDMLEFRIRIALGTIKDETAVSDAIFLTSTEKAICLLKFAEKVKDRSMIEKALLKAKENAGGVVGLSLVLEAQMKHKVAGAKATFNEIQKMLSQHNESGIDCETWERIALADFELNYKPWSLNSLRFWA